MATYVCVKCKKKFEVVHWGTFILGSIMTFGYAAFRPYFYCDKCYGEIKNG